MAIFRAETKHISRGKGHNVVAAAAYRSGEKLTDTNSFNPDATTHDYTKKKGVMATGIILPKSLSEQDFSIDRQSLWSSVEQSETTTRSVKGSRLKQTARLAREWLLALPSELSDEENEQLTAAFTQRLADDLEVIGDYCIHKPTTGNYKPKKDYIESYDPDTGKVEQTRVDDVEATEPDQRNIHAHIMFTTRKVTLDKGSLAFGEKADSERSELWRQEQELGNGGDYIKEIRNLWADMINQRLEQKHILPITAKSYKDLGINIIPQHKQGKDASVMALYGFKPPIIGFNNDIKQANRAVIKSAADRCIARESQEAELGYRGTEQAADSIKAAGEWLSTANPMLERRAKQRVSITSARDSGANRLSDQTSFFDRLAERANSVSYQPSREIIDKAVTRYENTVSYSPVLSLSDWVGGGTKPNPEPNSRPLFNKRQLSVLDNVDKHTREIGGIHLGNSKLRKDLHKHSNKWILTMLLDPTKDQARYDEDEREAYELAAIHDQSLLKLDANTSKSAASEVLEDKSIESKEPTLTPPKRIKIYTPSFR